jgi:hypothetical protein
MDDDDESSEIPRFVMTKRILFLCATMAWVLWLAMPRAYADDSNRLARLKIRVLPEYDQPTVLVWMTATLADGTNLPRDVSVLVPSTAALNATAWEDEGGTPHEAPAQSTNLGDGFTRVTFSVAQSTFRVEYYDDLLRGAPDKTLNFTFKAFAPVDQVSLELQQPRTATNFSVTPPVSTSSIDTDGLQTFVLPFSNVVAGQTLSAQVKYTKTDSTLSFPPSAAQPGSVPVSAPASSAANNIYLIAVIIVVGLTALLGVYLWQRRRFEASPARAGTVPGRRKPHNGQSASTVFCTQCGNALKPDDLFCSKCGTKRRVG